MYPDYVRILLRIACALYTEEKHMCVTGWEVQEKSTRAQLALCSSMVAAQGEIGANYRFIYVYTYTKTMRWCGVDYCMFPQTEQQRRIYADDAFARIFITYTRSQNRAADIKTIQYYSDGVCGSMQKYLQRGLSYDITTTAAAVSFQLDSILCGYADQT